MAAPVQRGVRWTTRSIPFALGACAGFATYIVIKRICVDHFLSTRELDRPATAIVFLVLYPVLLVCVLLSYLRVFLAIQTNPGLVPLGAQAVKARLEEARKRKQRKTSWRDLFLEKEPEKSVEFPQHDVGSGELAAGPGLDAFYTRDVFICADDGRPKWCSNCQNWKMDRVHHCSDINRCVRKMDHYCPWVGGVVGETSFKFFVQFNFYATLYCIVTLVAAALCLALLVRTPGLGSDGFLIALLGLAGFFGLFTLTMTATSFRFIWTNLTNIDFMKSKTLVYQVAIRVPESTTAGADYGIVTFPSAKGLDEKPLITPPRYTADRLAVPRTAATSSPSEGTVTATVSSDRTAVASFQDGPAVHTFAVVKTKLGENPWDLGPSRNWRSIMGDRVIDWFLPIRPSPCEKSECDGSFYDMGSLITTLRKRYGLPEAERRSARLKPWRPGRSDAPLEADARR